MSNADVFAEVATAFCGWVASAPLAEVHEAAQARRHLASLYAAALALAPTNFLEYGVNRPSEAEWAVVYRRGAALPFNYYSVADALAVPDAEVTTGDLADDLADIWSDVHAGLLLYRAGKVAEAAQEWRSGFDIHWGKHAADALAALQAWHSRNPPA